MTIGIIGYGRFGKLWADVMRQFGDVFVFSPNEKNGNRSRLHFVQQDEVLSVDILFLLVPISEIGNVCHDIATRLNAETIVVDACSVKVKPAEAMIAELSHHQPIIATHPLFGPDSVKRMGLVGQKIVVSRVRVTDDQFLLLKIILEKLELKIIEASPEEHDRQMARSQALVHFLGRAFAHMHLENQEIATPDFDSLLRINDLVNNDTWELFFDMQTQNPYAKEVRLELLTALKNLEEKIEKYET